MGFAFGEALLAADRPLIMEIKRRDAHGNDLLGGRPVADVVAEYVAAGAPCLSVVTGRWFGGDIDMLREVAAATDRPVLQKDFITRREQVYQAARLGASAVLLTATLLPSSSMAKLVELCLSVGLTPFVEVTTEAEILAVPQPEDCVIAVNNKDIKTGEKDTGDIGRSLRLLPALRRAGTRVPVSASGIDTPEIAARLLGAGYRGLLVATSLLRTESLASWMSTLEAAR